MLFRSKKGGSQAITLVLQAKWQASEGGEYYFGPLVKGVQNVYNGGTVYVLEDIMLSSGNNISPGDKTITITSADENDIKTISRGANMTGNNSTTDCLVYYDPTTPNTLTIDDLIFDGGSSIRCNLPVIIVEDDMASLILGSGVVVQNNNSEMAAVTETFGGSITINGATIKDNIGGGVYADTRLSINGCTITGNNRLSTDYVFSIGCGVALSSNAECFLSGDIIIKDNVITDTGELSNFYLDKDDSGTVMARPVLTGKLGDDSQIGISVGIAPSGTYTKDVAVSGASYDVTQDDASKFTSDRTDLFTEYVGQDKSVVLAERRSGLDFDGIQGTFSDLEYGYTQGSEATFTIKNSGNVPLSGISASVTDDFEIIESPAESLDVYGTTTITVRSKTGLPGGTKEGVLTVTAENADDKTCDLSQKVTKADQAPISIDGWNNVMTEGGSFEITVVGGSSGEDLSFVCQNCTVSYRSGNVYTVKIISAGDYSLTVEMAGKDSYNDICSETYTGIGEKEPVQPQIIINGIISGETYEPGDLSFSVSGCGLDNVDPEKGDIKYVPVAWSVNPSGTWSESPYKASFTLTTPGTHTLTVTFDQYTWDGIDWVSSGEQIQKNVEFFISSEVSTPETGDNSNVAVWIVLCLVSAVTVAVSTVFMKRKKSKYKSK